MNITQGGGIDLHARLVICFKSDVPGESLAFRSGFLLRALQRGAFRLTAGLIDLDRGVENACADAAGGVLSVMGNRDAGGGAREVGGCREGEIGGTENQGAPDLGLIREMKAVS